MDEAETKCDQENKEDNVPGELLLRREEINAGCDPEILMKGLEGHMKKSDRSHNNM